MEGIRYQNPREAAEGGELPQHHLDLFVDGNRIGGAEIDYHSKPLPLYQVTDLYVDAAYKGKGHASQIMDYVERWIRDRKKPGILADAIMEGSPAQGMYARRGWVEVPNSHGLYVFNWPSDTGFSILAGYSSRYTDLSERRRSAK